MVRVAGIIKESVVDGPGIRYVVFFQGCLHACKGCHNPDTWDIYGGRDMEVAEIVDDIKSNPLLSGVTISGGEPFLQVEALLDLLQAIRATSPGKSIIVYTGYTLDELRQMTTTLDSRLFDGSLIDYIIEGPFIEDLRCELPYRGSSNQRIVDVRKAFRR